MDIEQLTKIYAGPHFRTQEKRRAMHVHKHLNTQNWTLAGGSKQAGRASEQTIRGAGTTQCSTRMSVNKEFAKSYGHGGFFR